MFSRSSITLYYFVLKDIHGSYNKICQKVNGGYTYQKIFVEETNFEIILYSIFFSYFRISREKKNVNLRYFNRYKNYTIRVILKILL